MLATQPPCLSQGFYSCTNIMTRKQAGVERVSSAYTLHTALYHQGKSGLELMQVRKQELMQRPWRDAHYWLASPGLLSLLSYRTQDYQPREMVPPTRGPSPLITNWENALQLDLMEAFPQLKLLSLSQLCQVDTKLSQYTSYIEMTEWEKIMPFFRAKEHIKYLK